MRTSDPPLRYCAYLLRCWVEHSGNPEHHVVWRFSVEDPHTGERQGFASFDQLLAFLRSELRDAPLNAAGDDNEQAPGAP